MNGKLMSHSSLILFMGVLLSAVACLDASEPPIIDQPELDQSQGDMMVLSDLDIAPDMTMADYDQEMIIDMRAFADVPIQATNAVVKLNTEVTVAGELNRLSCLVYGENGQVLPFDPDWGRPRYDIRPLEGWRWDDEEAGIIFGEKSQQYEAKCLIPSLGLRSEARPWLVRPASLQELVMDEILDACGATLHNQ